MNLQGHSTTILLFFVALFALWLSNTGRLHNIINAVHGGAVASPGTAAAAPSGTVNPITPVQGPGGGWTVPGGGTMHGPIGPGAFNDPAIWEEIATLAGGMA